MYSAPPVPGFPSPFQGHVVPRQPRLEHVPFKWHRHLNGKTFSIKVLEGDSPIRLSQSDRIALWDHGSDARQETDG